jgi:hypothetical protein
MEQIGQESGKPNPNAQAALSRFFSMESGRICEDPNESGREFESLLPQRLRMNGG